MDPHSGDGSSAACDWDTHSDSHTHSIADIETIADGGAGPQMPGISPSKARI